MLLHSSLRAGVAAAAELVNETVTVKEYVMHATVAQVWGLDNFTLAEVAIFDHPGIFRYEEERRMDEELRKSVVYCLMLSRGKAECFT